MIKSFNGRHKNNFIYRSLIILLVIVILSTFIVELFLYNMAKDELENTIYRYNEIRLDGVLRKLSQCLSEIEKSAEELLANEKIQNVLNNPEYTDEDLYNVMSVLRNHKAGRYISGINLYICNWDTMVTSSKAMKSVDFYNNENIVSEDYTYKEWKENILSGVQYKKYFPILKKAEGTSTLRFIYYGQSYPCDRIENITGRLYFLIDVDKFLDEIQMSYNIKEGSLFILDGKRNIVMSSDEDSTAMNQILTNIMGENHGVVESADDRYVGVYARMDKINNWTCIYLLEKNTFFERIYIFRNWLLVVSFIYLVIIAAFCLIVINKTYLPIKNALRRITNTNDEKVYSNEIDLIMNQMERIQQEKITLEAVAQKRVLFGKSAVLLKMCKRELNVSERERAMKVFDISFIYDYFYIITVRSESNGVFAEENMAEGQELISAAISNILEELIEESKLGICNFVKNDIIIAIINTVEKSEENFNNNIKTVLNTFSDIMLNEFEIGVTIGVSELSFGIDGIADCYDDAMTALNFEMNKKYDKVKLFSDIKNDLARKKLYYYSFENEKKILNYLCVGDYENLSEILNEIMSINSKIGLSGDIKKRLCYDIMGTLLKGARMLSISDTIVEEVFKDVDFEKTAFDESFSIIKKSYKIICGNVAESKEVQPKGLIYDCERYVRENYMKFDIGVLTLAEHFNVSRQSIFNLFKQNLNISPSEYISQIRIEKAKELLMKNEMNNTQIANAVGFTNDKTFMRVFKKYEGVTPKKFRNIKFENE